MATAVRHNCLALETAVGSGSIAVLSDGVVIAESSEDMRPSRAEELLGSVREVLTQAGVELKDLSLIAVSTGPGSYSGIRIGLSTAIGLKNSLGIDCRGVSLLEAIAHTACGESEGEIVTAVPVGKNDIAWQRFDCLNGVRQLTKPTLVALDDFRVELQHLRSSSVQAPRDVLDRAGLDGTAATYRGTLASLVGRFAVDQPSHADLKPIYLRSAAGF